MMNKLTDSEIINCLNDTEGKEDIGIYCTDKNGNFKTVVKLTDLVDLLNRQKAEIAILKSDLTLKTNDYELLKTAYEQSENVSVGRKDRLMKAVVELQEARKEIERLQKIIVGFMDEVGIWSNKYEVDISTILKLPLLAKEDFNIRNKIKSEAIKEFAERLCNGRVSNDPVVIAVKAELKEMCGE